MRNSAPGVAEFTGGQSFRGGFDRERCHFTAADLPPTFGPRAPPILEEVSRAPLVIHVIERAAHDEDHHDDDVSLHDDRRYGCRKLRDWIVCKHSPAKCWESIINGQESLKERSTL